MRSEIIAKAAYSSFETVYNNLPSKEKVVKTALTMATSAIALEALASLQGAEAGPITYAACIAACGGATGPLAPTCLAACLPTLGPWCP